MARVVLFLCALVAVASAIELTPETWEKETAGKTVFVKFFAPWCGHCKSMKPDWDKLMKKYEGNKDALVADVDCIGEGKDLCSEHGVEGFPTIKWGDASSLEDYEGGRDFEDLDTFAAENLKPRCGPANIELCSDEMKGQIKKIQAMSTAELKKAIAAKDEEVKAVSDHFDAEVEKLQAAYEALEKEKGDKAKAIKESGLGLMKSVLAGRKEQQEL